MRVFVAALGTETNTFSPIPTGLGSFEEYLWFPAGTHPEEPRFFTGPLVAARQRATSDGFTLIEGLSAFAAPAGITTKAAWEKLKGQVLAELQAAMPVDIVLLSLHGAMVAEGEEDCEGALLEAVCRLVGPKTILAAELDPHCHLTQRMVTNAHILVMYKEYPHTDTFDRAKELVDLALRTAKGEIKPVMAVADCRMIGTFHTTREPVKSFVAKLRALEGRDGILSVSFGHCFPWADVADLDAKMLVVADGDGARAQILANHLAGEVRAMRGNTAAGMVGHEEGLAAAMASPLAPIVLADTSDNAGGGAPSDSTYLLRLLLGQKIQNACIGPFFDPQAVGYCHLAGVGATLRLRLGGKTGAVSGDPIDVEAEVLHLARGARQRFSGGWTQLGDVAAIAVGGVEILLNATRTQGFDPALFTDHGIEVARKKLVIVKSAQHFYAGFAPVAAHTIWLDGPGALPQDFRKLPYTRVRRPIWPLDAAELAFDDAIGMA